MGKTSRKKNNSSNHNTGAVVLSAIKKLMKNTGWTARTIVKFIKMEYSINDPNLSRKVSRALKRGVRLGLLQTDGGRYRLNDMSALAPSIGKKQSQREDKPVCIRSRSGTKIHGKRKLHG